MRGLVIVGFAVAWVVGAGACAAKGTGGFDGPEEDAGADAAGADGGGAGAAGAPGTAGGPGAFGDGGGTPDAREGEGETVLWAHDNKSLYRVDPKDPALGVTKVGDFDCIQPGATPPAGKDTSMTDVAVDRDGKLYGVGPKMFFADITVDATGAHCVGKGKDLPVAGNVKFFGASFAPVGTVSAQAEALVVGNTDGELYEVDLVTGQTTILGTFGAVPANDGNGHAYVQANRGKAWELSGDIAFVANNGTPVGFATVRDCPNPPSQSGCNTTDTLVELDMTKLRRGNTGSVTRSVRGQIVKAAGCTDNFNAEYGSMYGIVAYQGDILGFSRDSFVVRIDNSRGGACRIADHAATVPSGFSGAGITTLAPIVAPPPR